MTTNTAFFSLQNFLLLECNDDLAYIGITHWRLQDGSLLLLLFPLNLDLRGKNITTQHKPTGLT